MSLISNFLYSNVRAHFSSFKNIVLRDQLLQLGVTLFSNEKLSFSPLNYQVINTSINSCSADLYLPEYLLDAFGAVSSGYAILDNVDLIGDEAYALYRDHLVLESCQGRLGYPLYRGDVRSLLLRNVYGSSSTYSSAISLVHSLSSNYFHFLIETLPLLGAVKSALGSNTSVFYDEPIACFVPKDRPSFIDFWINEALHGLVYTVPWIFKKVDVKALIVSTLPYHILSKETIPTWGIQRYLDSSLSYVRELGLRSCPSSIETSTPKKLFLSRKGSSRIILNEVDVEAFLVNHDYTKVFLEDLQIPEQISLFQNATHLICLHGAGMANLVFSSQPHIIELFPATRRPEMLHFYSQLSTWIEAKHTVLICDSDANENIFVDLKILADLL